MKNPWMSLWLSAANASMSSARGLAAAQARRAQTAMFDEMTRQATAFWFPASAPAAKTKRRRAAKRR